MKVLYIDTETTSLNPSVGQAIQIGMLWDDGVTPLESAPSIEILVKWPEIRCDDAVALKMNAALIARIADGEGMSVERAASALRTFIHVNCTVDKLNIGGKNPTFDLAFLEPFGFSKKGISLDGSLPIRFDHRLVDPGTLWALPSDLAIPGLARCLHRAGLPDQVDHTALSDCINTARAVRAGLQRNEALRSAGRPIDKMFSPNPRDNPIRQPLIEALGDGYAGSCQPEDF